MSKIIQNYSFLFIIFSIILTSNTQILDKNVLKAAGCITLVKKLKNKPTDQRIITSFLLSCFINIDEDTANKLLQNQYYDNIGIEESQIMKLIDFNSIQKRYTEQQIEQYSKALNTALEPLRDKPGNHQPHPDNPYDDENPNSEEENNVGLVDSITNYFVNLFTSSDSILLLFVLFGVFYFCLQKMRKWFGNDDKDDKNGSHNKKNNKSNKNTKRKKK